MATITTDTFLDGGTARTAGESWTINGCTLTIRTDTRWHANAPASMTGSLGAITTNAGKFFVEGRNVRWLPFDTGLGTVPAIGTTITQGGVSGYLLGVWAGYTSAPTAVGSDMPASGYIKFREVTGGTFSAGPLSGISANASSPDVVGWIEVVGTQSSSITSSGLGEGYVLKGDWFYLGTTNGSAGQIFQAPTNGGGTNTRICGIQVETSPGSNVYEWWPAATLGWTTTALNTDVRAKFVQALDSAQVRIGSDGTNNIGYVPSSGCKVRIPNIIMRQCASATPAVNALPHTSTNSRPRLSSTSSGGRLDFDKVMSDWWWDCNSVQSLVFANSIFEAKFQTTNPGYMSITNCSNGYCSSTTDSGLGITSLISSGVITDCKFYSQGSSAPFTVTTTGNNLSISNLELCVAPPSKTAATVMTVVLSNSTITNLKTSGGTINISGNNVSLTTVDYIERPNGDTTSTGANNQAISLTGTNFYVSNLTFGNGGTLSNRHPYNTVFSISGAGPFFVRNIGSYNSPIPTGASSTLWPQYLFTFLAAGSNTTQSKFQRIFIENVRTAPCNFSSTVLNTNMLFEQIGSMSTKPLTTSNSNASFKGMYFPHTASSTSINTGVHWFDSFTNATSGKVSCIFTGISTMTAPYAELYLTNPASGFNGSGCYNLKSINEYIILETPYFIKGHTGFANTALTFSGVNQANHSFEYQIDTGSGWNGVWKTISGANLSSESFNSTDGFKLKIKVKCIVASTTNTVIEVALNTITTTEAQSANLYPLDTNTLTFTNLVPGSEVRCYTGSDPATAVEIGGTESSGTSFSFTHSSGGSVGFIRIFALGYQPFNYDPYTYQAADTTLLVQQVIDRNYVNP